MNPTTKSIEKNRKNQLKQTIGHKKPQMQIHLGL